jgi:hypothetical protein
MQRNQSLHLDWKVIAQDKKQTGDKEDWKEAGNTRARLQYTPTVKKKSILQKTRMQWNRETLSRSSMITQRGTKK